MAVNRTRLIASAAAASLVCVAAALFLSHHEGDRDPQLVPETIQNTQKNMQENPLKKTSPDGTERVRYRLQGILYADGILDSDGTLTVRRTMKMRKGGSGARIAWPHEVKKVVWPEGVVKPLELD